ncbi:MAG: ACP phosphodiesterase [Candidatus Azobacteroides sp.]|nr:ACP phosphodiesterase [Candidatus Azobacteroides sp.]
MNYLMHLYLSDNDENLLVGNFIADHVKGKKVNEYPPEIAHGIILHRAIDEFSDQHPAVAESKKMLRPVYGKYAGVVVDIFYDHFLAADFSRYASVDLNTFAGFCYRTLLKHWISIPWEVKLFLPFLIKHKRLQSYAKLSGIGNALHIMAKHTSLPDKSGDAIKILKENYAGFRSNFEQFFPDIRFFSSEKIVR